MSPLRVAIDAMGGDFGCESILPAVIMAAKQYPAIEFVLYGDLSTETAFGELANQSREQSTLSLEPLSNIKYIVADTHIAMDESPKLALRHKRDSSMGLALQSVASGESHGCVSAGNTGALVALGMHILKCYQGLTRPALCKAVPVFTSNIEPNVSDSRAPACGVAELKHSYLLDLGANVDCSAQQLEQFAYLGTMLCSSLEALDNPSVRLLNVGMESFKGSLLIQEAAACFEKVNNLNYQGFIEADEIFQGVSDVIVCDGFSGNIALKASEGVARIVTNSLKCVLTDNILTRILASLFRPALRRWHETINPDRYNGAYLLGLKGTVVKSHGSANAQQFFYALEMLIKQLQQQAIMLSKQASVNASGQGMEVSSMESIFIHKCGVSA